MGQGKELKKIKKFLELNENENTIYSNLLDTTKLVLISKLIAVGTCIKNLKRVHISNLTTHLKVVDQKEEIVSKSRR